MRSLLPIIVFTFAALSVQSQDYFFKQFAPFDAAVPSPEQFLGYEIGEYHTRHDRIVAYFETLAAASDKASLIDYGKTHELRRLVILQISNADHLNKIETHRQRHLLLVDPSVTVDVNTLNDLPVFVNLGYNVHGNEPSSSEAAMLSAYVLIASNHPDIQRYRSESITFVDPCINPDGRDRHTQWANSHRGNPLVKDPMDAEHNEQWPRGRTNHYWFDLNRDWLLAVHPESQGKLAWYHQWYPNVVTDFHEMGSNSSYFFEPMKTNGSKNPIMPKENYIELNDLFATYYQRELDNLGSLYFTKEVFDGTYPGYGSSYPDLQGGLGILFEQASSRGHVQKTDMGDITFPFTIRNQFVNSIATVEAAVENKTTMHKYQQDFFKSAISNARASGVKAYKFKEEHDKGRVNAFLDLLIKHKVKVYHDINDSNAYLVPTEQPQYRMVQTMFETYEEYQDSVYYDASAWSLANAYNIDYNAHSTTTGMGQEVTMADLKSEKLVVANSDYAYLISWDDYFAPAMLYHLVSNKVRLMATQKPFTLETSAGDQSFSYGTLVIPVQKQEITYSKLLELLQTGSDKWGLKVHSAVTGYSKTGIDLGSRYINPLDDPKPIMLIGDGTSSYEVGFVWHLLDQRMNMPITKLKTSMFGRADLDDYNTMVLVSGSYNTLDSMDCQKIKSWTGKGNTLITIGSATAWAIKNKIVKETLIKKDDASKDSTVVKRSNYVDASEIRGKDEVGGTIFDVDLDITHPIGYGYHNKTLPVYRNNSVWVKPSKSEFNNVALYTDDPHVDGFITKENLDKYLKKSASIITSKVGSGRAVLFSEDPNFRGTWWGTNKLFLNALFFGDMIRAY